MSAPKNPAPKTELKSSVKIGSGLIPAFRSAGTIYTVIKIIDKIEEEQRKTGKSLNFFYVLKSGSSKKGFIQENLFMEFVSRFVTLELRINCSTSRGTGANEITCSMITESSIKKFVWSRMLHSSKANNGIWNDVLRFFEKHSLTAIDVKKD